MTGLFIFLSVALYLVVTQPGFRKFVLITVGVISALGLVAYFGNEKAPQAKATAPTTRHNN